MLSRVENLLPRPHDSSESMDYFFPRPLQQNKLTCLWLWDSTQRFWISLNIDLVSSNFYNIGSWDFSRNNTGRRYKRAFGYKTLDLQKRHKMHSNLSKKLWKPFLGLAYNVLSILENTAHDLGFKRISYGLFTFVDFTDMRLSIDQVPIERNRLQLISFHPEHEFFCLGLQCRPF